MGLRDGDAALCFVEWGEEEEEDEGGERWSGRRGLLWFDEARGDADGMVVVVSDD